MKAWSGTDDGTPSATKQPDAEPVFEEPFGTRCRRWALGTAYALQPKRIHLMPRLAALTIANVIHPVGSTQQLLREHTPFGEEGLIGISDDLSVEAFIDAYSMGAFPVCHVGAMKWWSPAHRAIQFFEKTHIEKSTLSLIKKKEFTASFDKDFAGVVRACAEPRDGRTPLTWLTPRMMEALWRMHKAGYAHSIELRNREGLLVGGMFGIGIGRVFFGESQFSKVRDVSKVATAVLNCHLSHWGFALRDAKFLTPYLSGLGFTTVDRQTFLSLLQEHVHRPGYLGPWEFDTTLDVAQWASQVRKAAHS